MFLKYLGTIRKPLNPFPHFKDLKKYYYKILAQKYLQDLK